MAVNYGQVAIVPKGEWNVETQYKVNNLVSYDGNSYVAKVQPPVGTLPTDTSYWQVSAAGTKKATADSLGTVMPDGTTTSVGEDGKLSVNTAQQDALGVVKGSDDITVGEDGTLAVNTTFEQATALANIIAGEAIKSVLGKVSKAIATTMSLDENALLKNMISGIDVNDSNKVPSSAYIHTLVERIGMGTELVSGLGDLTTGLNTVNNNLSNRFAASTSKNVYNSLSDFPETGSGFGVTTTGLTLYDGFNIPAYSRICFMNHSNSKDGAIFAIDGDGKSYTAFRNNGTWHVGNSLATKADLGKFLIASGSAQAKENSYTTVTSIKLPAGHTYLIIGSNQVSKSLTSIISSQLVGFNSAAEIYSFYLGDSRTTGLSGGGCLCAAIVSTKAECTILLQGYGYSSETYDYIGKLFAVQLA